MCGLNFSLSAFQYFSPSAISHHSSAIRAEGALSAPMSNTLEQLFQSLVPIREKLILAGGFAVNAHGYTRNTLDVDFICSEKDLIDVKNVLIQLGYSNIDQTKVALHCQHPDNGFRIDMLVVEQETFDDLQNSTIVSEVTEALVFPTLSLEHLLSMKLHALQQHEGARRDKDLPDIAWLTVLNELSLEQDLKPLCLKYGSEDLYDQISKTIRNLEA
jgi:hypothetical protein